MSVGIQHARMNDNKGYGVATYIGSADSMYNSTTAEQHCVLHGNISIKELEWVILSIILEGSRALVQMFVLE